LTTDYLSFKFLMRGFLHF